MRVMGHVFVGRVVLVMWTGPLVFRSVQVLKSELGGISRISSIFIASTTASSSISDVLVLEVFAGIGT